MKRTKIEYGDYSLPLVTGCRHTPDICACSADCWARDMAHRFHRDFTPTLHPERLRDRMPKHPSRILVSFTGEMFGSWWRTPELGDWDKLVLQCQGVASQHPQHQFLFLTKNPSAYRLFDPWPNNCWLGMTLTGVEPMWRQVQMWDALEKADAHIRWLSYEPPIAPLLVPMRAPLSWVVVGGWSGRRPVSEEGRQGIESMLAQCAARTIPVWEKSNLSNVLEGPLRQEVPQ